VTTVNVFRYAAAIQGTTGLVSRSDDALLFNAIDLDGVAVDPLLAPAVGKSYVVKSLDRPGVWAAFPCQSDVVVRVSRPGTRTEPPGRWYQVEVTGGALFADGERVGVELQ
jgi:hypothetical protein